jgi:hypothetical protein
MNYLSPNRRMLTEDMWSQITGYDGFCGSAELAAR